MTDNELLVWALESLARVKTAVRLQKIFPFFWAQSLGGAVAGLRRGQPGAAKILRACHESWSLFPPSERALFSQIPLSTGVPPRSPIPDGLSENLEEIHQ